MTGKIIINSLTMTRSDSIRSKRAIDTIDKLLVTVNIGILQLTMIDVGLLCYSFIFFQWKSWLGQITDWNFVYITRNSSIALKVLCKIFASLWIIVPKNDLVSCWNFFVIVRVYQNSIDRCVYINMSVVYNRPW